MANKYWDINKILPYQRCFNFINAERSIGKTYTTEKYVVDKCKKLSYEFVYLVRTQDEKKRGILQSAFEKVLLKEFPSDEIEFTNEEMFLIIRDSEGELQEKITLGYCLALSEAVKIKKRSFPKVKYLIFDEYMLENKQGGQYVNGWKEPDLFLSIYHTIDREEDRVICFLLGNNTSFFNPYHLHPAFSIPNIKKGKIWVSENVLFQWAISTNELKADKAKCKFLRMLDNTSYGRYAKDGDYVDDNYSFIEKMSTTAKYSMTIEYEGTKFGVYNDMKNGVIYVSDKVDPSCKLIYALTIDDHKENTLLTKTNSISQLKWLSNNFKLGNVRFVSMEVKIKCEKAIALLL